MAARIRTWKPTLVFNRFRDKNTSLSSIHSTAELGREAIKRALHGRPQNAQVIAELGSTMLPRQLPETVGDFLGHLDERAGAERLHLLMVCSANLESYLQQAAKLHVAALGYSDGPNSLNAIGKAIARPVVNSSTVPDMLKYLEALLSITFGAHRTAWIRGYKLRCEGAHEGGVVTGATLKEIPDLGLPVGAKITLDWASLKSYLHSAYEIASSIDKKIAKGRTRLLEVEWLIKEWKDVGLLPPRKDLWTAVHALGAPKIHRPTKQRIELEIY